jgi:diguanylate cyclase (GGDEF)-like protein/PAS domain S-box-containing protein
LGRAVELVSVAVIVADARAEAAFANRHWREMTGQDDGSWAGRGWLDALDAPDPGATLQAILDAIADGRTYDAEWTVRSESGGQRVVRASIAPDVDDTGLVPRFVVTAVDVTDERARTERLVHLATHDALTGLVNRQQFVEFAAHAIDRRQREPEQQVAVVFVDVVDLKHTNDQFGHHAGDDLLRDVAACIRSAVRPVDVVARYGGDEFTVLCEGLRTSDEAVGIALRIAQAAREGYLGRLDLSIGVATAGAGDSPADVIHAADDAMYLAKELRIPTPILRCSAPR